MTGMETTDTAVTKFTTCPYCGVGCGVEARVKARDDGRATGEMAAGFEGSGLIAVSGDTAHPANQGRLCVKGSALHQTVDASGRLLRPQVGGRAVDWDTALDTVADGFRRVIETHGPQSVAFYLSGQLLTEDYYVANKLMKGFVGSANVDTNSRLCMSSAVASYKRAFGGDIVPCNYEDLEQADLLVLVGSNAAWTHPVLFQRMVAARKARGTRVVVVDPRRTATCDIADLHLPLRPGSDGYLFAGLLRHLHQAEVLDHRFIEQHTRGFEESLAAADAFDAETTARECGLAVADVERFFEWFANTERTVTFYSMGINQSTSGTDKGNAIINCHLATGRLGKPGAGPFSITGQPNAMGGREVGGLANQLAAHMDFGNDEDIDRVARFWQAPNMAREPGLKAVELFEAIERGEVKAVWIMATNPVVSMPDADRVRRALAQCELVVVSDCQSDTDTAACADVLLPATGWSEKDGTVTNSERRISRQRALLAPAGEARPDWWIVTGVARRLGYGDAFAYECAADVFREHARLSGFENQGRRAFDISALATLSDADYDALQPVQWPVNERYPRGRARLFDDGHFYTGDGRARFVAVAPRPPLATPCNDYPVILNTGRIRDQWHTMTRTGKSPRLSQHLDLPFAAVHPDDMARHGLDEGGLVRIDSPLGHWVGVVQGDAGLRPGEAFVPIHWNDRFASQARVGALLYSHVDPVSGQPELKQTAVQLTPVGVVQWTRLLSRERIELPEGCLFWAELAVNGGYRYEIARADRFNWRQWMMTQLDGVPVVEYSDQAGQQQRCLWIEEGALCAAYSGPDRAALPEPDWLARALETPARELDTLSFLAGRNAAGEERGAIVCSCFEVGEKQIVAAIAAGAQSPEALGKALRCGTNCGSCIPELRNLIARSRRADAA